MIERLATQQRQNGILSPENAAPANRVRLSSISPLGGGASSNAFFSPMVASQLNQIKSSFAVWSHRSLTVPLSANGVYENMRARMKLYHNDVSYWHPNSLRRKFRREIRIKENRVC